MIASVPQMFPKCKARFKAFLALGKYYIDKGLLRPGHQAVRASDRIGKSRRAGGRPLSDRHRLLQPRPATTRRSSSLRRVTSEYPWSVFANECYYYIGQCHFKLGRWAKAVEALEMVGTSVDPRATASIIPRRASGSMSKSSTRTWSSCSNTNEKVSVVVTTKSGDKETLVLEPLGRTGEYYIGSIMTTPGEPKAGRRHPADHRRRHRHRRIHRQATPNPASRMSSAIVERKDGLHRLRRIHRRRVSRIHPRAFSPIRIVLFASRDLDRDITDGPTP